MSVYTTVEPAELKTFLARYALGDLISHSGIKAGVTNTNYWLETNQGCYVLTLFEHVNDAHLDYTLGLQHHLASQGVACAAPVVDNLSVFHSPLNNRPAAIIARVPGAVCSNPSDKQCSQIGAELARFHQAGRGYQGHQVNSRNLVWWSSMLTQLQSVLTEPDQLLIQNVINDYEAFDLSNLPLGAIHGDLFHDNALFDGASLGGIIDFDYACDDYFIYDLAITLNDWCIDQTGELDVNKVAALLSAYNRIRPLLDCETAALPIMLQVGALRFWLSRLYDQTFPLAGELTFIKDPNEFRHMLLLRRAMPESLAYAEAGKDRTE